MQTNTAYMPAEHRIAGIRKYFLWLFLMLLFLCFPSSVSDSVRTGLNLCTRALIPAVFPLLCLAPLTAASVSALCGGDTPRGALLSAFLIGMFCGFPMGAATLNEHVRNGRLSPETAQRFCAAVSAPSPAFLIGYVGVQLFGDATVGIRLFLIGLSVNGIAFFLRRKTTAIPPNPRRTETAALHGTPRLSDAITRGAQTMLSVCAIVVFYTVIRSFLLTCIAPRLPLAVSSFLSGIPEMTGGVASVADLYTQQLLSGKSACIMTSALCGFGGCSAAMQAAAVLPHSRDNRSCLFRCLAEKALQGVLCALLASVVFS